MTSRFKPAWPGSGHRYITIGEVRLDLCYRTLSIAGEAVNLPQRAFDLLWLLAAEPHALHYRTDLLERLWPGLLVEDANLSQSAWLLRKALGPERRGWLRTVVRAGYVFEPDEPVLAFEPEPTGIPALAEDVSPPPAQAQEGGLPADVAPVPPMPPSRPRGRLGNALLRWLSIAGGCLFSAFTLLAIAQASVGSSEYVVEPSANSTAVPPGDRQTPPVAAAFAISARSAMQGAGCRAEYPMRATSPCSEPTWGQ